MKRQKVNTTIKITSGLFRGQNLETPPSAHPMGSRERLALFNILAPYLERASVLDAFAGSGALGLEALSRGAKSATFLEKDPRAVEIIKRNVKNLNLVDDTKIIKTDATTFSSPEKYDLILIDPPYDQFDKFGQEPFKNLALLLSKGEDSRLALSHPSGFTPTFENLVLETSRKYANCNIAIFRNI